MSPYNRYKQGYTVQMVVEEFGYPITRVIALFARWAPKD